MKTILTVERLAPGIVLEKREQLCHSYTARFAEYLYTRHTQSAAYMPVAASTGQLCFGPGGVGWGDGSEWGILVGESSTPPTAGDLYLGDQIGHGRVRRGAVSQLVNPSFETGNFAGWSVGGYWSVVTTRFAGSTGVYAAQYYSQYSSTLSQAADLTNATALRFAHRGTTYARLIVTIGGITCLTRLGVNEGLVVIPLNYTGVQTIALTADSTYADFIYQWVDSFYLYSNSSLEHGATEVFPPTISGNTISMVVRRNFYNGSGSSVTIREVGLAMYPSVTLVCRDVIPGGITVDNTQTLRVTYTMQTTV